MKTIKDWCPDCKRATAWVIGKKRLMGREIRCRRCGLIAEKMGMR